METGQLIVLVAILVVILSPRRPEFSSYLQEIRQTLNDRLEASRDYSRELGDMRDRLADIEALIQDGLIAAGVLDPEKERAAALELASRVRSIHQEAEHACQGPSIDFDALAKANKAEADLRAKYGHRIYKAALAVNEKSAQ